MATTHRATRMVIGVLALLAMLGAPVGAQVGKLIDPNMAAENELQQLPHMTATIVKSMLERRPFKSVIELKFGRAVEMRRDAGEARQHEQGHQHEQRSQARGVASHDVPHDHHERERDENDGNELQRLLVMRQQNKLRHRPDQADHEQDENPAAQQLDIVCARICAGT